jgi:hypothetical protein
MDMIREDSQMYMFPGEMMALFNDGAVDVGHLFSSVEYMQPQPQQQQSSISTASHHQQNDRQGSGIGSVGGSDGTPGTGFTSSGFIKMNGMVNSS